MKRVLLFVFLITLQNIAFAEGQTYGSDSNGNTWSTQTFVGGQTYGSDSQGRSWQSAPMTGGGQTYGSNSEGDTWQTTTSAPDAFSGGY